MALYDKLSVINTALIRTGNDPCGLEDGSPEWIVASDAYDTELPLLISSHDWGFAKSFSSLSMAGASPDPRYRYAFAWPINCLHLVDVLIEGRPVDYDLAGSQIVCGSVYGPDDEFAATNPTAEIIQIPLPGQWPEHFIETLRQRVMSHVYRGLNEDIGEADRIYAASEQTLARAQTRSDQQSPPIKRLVSPMLAGRRIRRTGSPFYWR